MSSLLKLLSSLDLWTHFYTFWLDYRFEFWLFQLYSSLMFGWLLQMFKDLLVFKFVTLIYIWYGLLQWILIILLGLFVAFCLKLKIAAPMVVVSNHGPLFTNCIASCYLSLSLVGFVATMLALLYVMFDYWFCSEPLFSSALFQIVWLFHFEFLFLQYLSWFYIRWLF